MITTRFTRVVRRGEERKRLNCSCTQGAVNGSELSNRTADGSARRLSGACVTHRRFAGRDILQDDAHVLGQL
jgi:hypothetical protein